MPGFDKINFAQDFQRGKVNQAQNTLNDMAIRRANVGLDQQEQAIQTQDNLNAKIGEMGNVRPEGRNQYIGELASQGTEGLALVKKVRGIWDEMDNSERAEYQEQVNASSKLLTLAVNPETYDIARQQAIEANPELAEKLPPEWSQQTATIIQGQINKIRSIENILKENRGGDPGQDPSSVKEYKYRQGLEGGIGGEADKAFLAGKRAEQYLNTGDKFTGVGNASGKSFEINPRTSETPEYKAEVATAVAEAKAKVAKIVTQQGQFNKLDEADAIYKKLSDGDLGKIYGRGESFYPDYLRSQEGVDMMAQRDQLVGMLKIGARGQLKGQGQVSDSEQKMLGESVTILGNPNISPQMAKMALDSAMGILYGSAGEEFGGNVSRETNQPQVPTEGETQDGYRFKGGDPANPDSWEKL